MTDDDEFANCFGSLLAEKLDSLHNLITIIIGSLSFSWTERKPLGSSINECTADSEFMGQNARTCHRLFGFPFSSSWEYHGQTWGRHMSVDGQPCGKRLTWIGVGLGSKGQTFCSARSGGRWWSHDGSTPPFLLDVDRLTTMRTLSIQSWPILFLLLSVISPAAHAE